MNNRTLEYEVGNLIFHWDLTSSYIMIYQTETHWLLAKLTIMTSEAQIIPFTRKAFEKHCNWFVRQGITKGRQALEAAIKLEEFLEGKRDEEEGWDDLALYSGLVRSFIERYGDSP